MAVYDKNNSGAGDKPEDTLDSMVDAGKNVPVSGDAEDAAAKAAQRRAAARERLEAKIAADASAERRRRRNILLIIVAIVVVIALIVASVLIANKVKDDRERAEAAEAAKWANCQWYPEQKLPDLVEQAQKAKDEVEKNWEEAQEQLKAQPADQQEETRKQYNQQIAQADAFIAWAPTAQSNLDSLKRTVEAPSNGTYPRTGKVQTVLKTSAGTLHIDLIHAYSACNNAAFEKMIREKYFNDTSCHRLTNSDQLKVLQCGDPTMTGMGGPSFYSQDETPNFLLAAAGAEGQGADAVVTYPKGTVAVAKSQNPNTGGSQFFILLGDSQLPAAYTVIGKVSPKDFAVLDRIKTYDIVVAPGTVAPEEGDVTDGAPGTPIEIEYWKILKTSGVETQKVTN